MYESRKVAIEPSLKRLKESREASHYMFWHSEQSVFTRYNTSSKSNQLDAAAHTVQEDKTDETFATNALQAKALLDPSNSHLHHYNNQEPEPAMNYERTRKSVTRDDNGCGSGNRMDPNKLAKRRAALTKLIQKKNRRLFNNKVDDYVRDQ
ncbi:unnamed protein product [Cuscuta campestris]|uniref:Uncharacterized protein n=1 Tax=Cuscuta campestris TaxID=132261 RepID=A0A484M7Y5_9ASTE|nr:unnamed protein product [Cuscuta campestris]